jgi:hypothetical protein
MGNKVCLHQESGAYTETGINTIELMIIIKTKVTAKPTAYHPSCVAGRCQKEELEWVVILHLQLETTSYIHYATSKTNRRRKPKTFPTD